MFENTHEAIIDEETFARVQELRKNKRRPTRTDKTPSYAPLPAKRERKSVTHTSSALWYWKKVRYNT